MIPNQQKGGVKKTKTHHIKGGVKPIILKKYGICTNF